MSQRTLEDILRDRISSGEARVLRYRHKEVMKKSSGSYEGPIIKLSNTMPATSYLPSEPVRYLPVYDHPRASVWHECQDPAVDIIHDTGINWRSLLAQLERDADDRSRPVLLIVVHDASNRGIWRETTVSLHKMLYVRDATDLAIQFTLPGEPQDKCFAIAPNHPLFTIWKQGLNQRTLDLVERHSHWTTISVF